MEIGSFREIPELGPESVPGGVPADIDVTIIRGAAPGAGLGIEAADTTSPIVTSDSRRTVASVHGEVPAASRESSLDEDVQPSPNGDGPPAPGDGGDMGNKPPGSVERRATGDEPEGPLEVHSFDNEHVLRREIVEVSALQVAAARSLVEEHRQYTDRTGAGGTEELALEYRSDQGTADITVVDGDIFDVTFKNNGGAESRHVYLTERYSGMVVRQDRIPETAGLEVPHLGELPTSEIWDLQRRRESPHGRYEPDVPMDLDRHIVGPSQMQFVVSLARLAEPKTVSAGDLRDLALRRGMATHLPDSADATLGAREFTEYVTTFLHGLGYDLDRSEAVSDSIEVSKGATSMHVVAGMDRAQTGERLPYVRVGLSGIFDPEMLRALPPEHRAQFKKVEGGVHLDLRYGLAAGRLVSKRTLSVTGLDGDIKRVALHQDTTGVRLVPGDVAEARQVRNFLRRPTIG